MALSKNYATGGVSFRISHIVAGLKMGRLFGKLFLAALALSPIFLVAFACLFFFAKELPLFKDISAFFDPPTFPDVIEIQSQDNRRITVELSGRSNDYIEFRTLPDRSLFTYPIRSLSKQSQQDVLRYPDTGLGNSASLLVSGQISLEEVHIQNARFELENIDKKIHQLSKKSELQTGSQRQATETDIQKLREKRQRLESSILERRPHVNVDSNVPAERPSSDELDQINKIKQSTTDAFKQILDSYPASE